MRTLHEPRLTAPPDRRLDYETGQLHQQADFLPPPNRDEYESRERFRESLDRLVRALEAQGKADAVLSVFRDQLPLLRRFCRSEPLQYRGHPVAIIERETGRASR